MKNHIIKSVLCLMAAMPVMAFAHTGSTSISANSEPHMAPSLLERHVTPYNSCVSELKLCDLRQLPRTSSETRQYAHVVLKESGTLASALGDRIYEIDSIAVEGPVNGVDFSTLWDSSFNGHLKIINLDKAAIEHGIVPEQALFHIDEQVDWDTMVITTTWLEKLILPDGVTEIGDFAFAYSTTLREIKFPSTLLKIGKAAFTDCIRLTAEQLILPESLRVIGEQAFYQCTALTGKVTLPESLRSIMCAAFYHCRISDINIPQSLEYMGCMAFAGSAFKTVSLPDRCMLCSQGGQFYNNLELTEAHLPDMLWFVPDDIFSGCMSLGKVNIPSRTITIGEFAFDGTKISKIDFPETLESIGQDAFQGCDMSTVVLPASLKSLADRAFALCYGLKSIYCRAAVPPAYIPASGYESDRTPFAGVDSTIPVYVPVSSGQQYSAAPGWDYITNFIETDEFPSDGVCDVMADETEHNSIIYDIYGRKVDNPAPGNIYIRNGRKFLCQ